MIFFRHVLKIAFRNVLRHFRQSTAALLSVAAALFAVVLFEGYMQNLKGLYQISYTNRGMLADFLIENQLAHSKEAKTAPWKFWLTTEEQADIHQFIAAHQKEIKVVLHTLIFQGLVTNGKTSNIFLAKGVDLKEGAAIRGDLWEWNTLNGKPLHLIEKESVLLGRSLGKALNCESTGPTVKTARVGNYPKEDRPFHCLKEEVQLSAVTETGQLNSLSLPVAGLVDGGYQNLDNRHLELSLAQAKVLLNTNKVTYMSILLENPNMMNALTKEFNQSVGKKYPSLRAINWRDHPAGEMYRKSMSMLGIFRNFVVIVILSVTTLSVMNTFVKIVKERTREIGTLQSMGFSARWIQRLFMTESFILCGFGILLGIILSVVIATIINFSPIYYKGGMLSLAIRLQIDLSEQAIGISALMLFLISGFSSWIACRQHAHRRVVDNLNFV